MLLMTTITGKKRPGKLYISEKKIVFRSTRKTSIRNTKTGEKIYNFSYLLFWFYLHNDDCRQQVN